MSGTSPQNVIQAIDILLKNEVSTKVPPEYLIEDTSQRVLNFIVSTVNQYRFWNSLYFE